jgi:hypothetical protein
MRLFTSHTIETTGDRAAPGVEQAMLVAAAQRYFGVMPGGCCRLGGQGVVCPVRLSGASAE